MKNQKGFTLMEVVIAITILSTLAILIGTSTSRSLKAKRRIQAEVSDVSALRDTLKIIRADISQAYNHYDFELEILDEAKKTVPPTNPAGGAAPANPNPPPPQQDPNASKRENKREDPRTQFMGESNKLSFVTMNQARLLTGELTADFIEVGYEVKSCKNLTDSEKVSQCLYRRTQKILDADVTEGGYETVILENISEFTLKYLGEGKTDYKADWKSKGGSDPGTNFQFPEAVEVNIGIETELDGKKRPYSLQAVIPLHFPNNTKPKAGSQSTITSQGGDLNR